MAVFPFYYAILTSFKSGTVAVRGQLLADEFNLANYVDVFQQRQLPAQPAELGHRRDADGGAGAAARGHRLLRAEPRAASAAAALLLLTILAVSMFPQIAVLAGLFELIRFFGLFNTLWALIFSYTIFTLPFTVWVLTTFMRDLPIEIEEAAIVDGATPWIIITGCSCR